MASTTPTIAISTAQAAAICKELGITMPKKDNGWRKVGNIRICRLPKRMRKSKKNAQAYRVTAPTAEELYPYQRVADEYGRAVCIVYQTEE